LMKKTKPFFWTTKFQEAWDQIKQKYMEAWILIPPNWQLKFHVHTDASLFGVGAMLAWNPIGKYDQPIVYAFKLLNKTKQHYTIIKRKALEWFMLCIIFRPFLLGNKFF
jgi:hypothetical protein